jgi:molybdate-binding protein
MDLKNLGKERIVGWHRDSEMRRLFESVLNKAGISAPKYVRLARTHSSVAAAVAKNLADLGFGENAAKQTGTLLPSSR